jgi:hypothetical protein
MKRPTEDRSAMTDMTPTEPETETPEEETEPEPGGGDTTPVQGDPDGEQI